MPDWRTHEENVFCDAVGLLITYFMAYFVTLLGRDLGKACLDAIRERIQLGKECFDATWDVFEKSIFQKKKRAKKTLVDWLKSRTSSILETTSNTRSD